MADHTPSLFRFLHKWYLWFPKLLKPIGPFVQFINQTNPLNNHHFYPSPNSHQPTPNPSPTNKTTLRFNKNVSLTSSRSNHKNNQSQMTHLPKTSLPPITHHTTSVLHALSLQHASPLSSKAPPHYHFLQCLTSSYLPPRHAGNPLYCLGTTTDRRAMIMFCLIQRLGFYQRKTTRRRKKGKIFFISSISIICSHWCMASS